MAVTHKRPGRWPVLLLLVGVAGLGGALAFHKASGKEDDESAKAKPALVRLSPRSLSLPEGSSYRDRVKVAAVEAAPVKVSRIFPAAVEADPVRTVNVLPPFTGRITELKAQLGDVVKKGQPLASMESGDLAQAIADAQKARASVKLTQSVLERGQNLTKVGGASQKDLDQAQNDFNQAQAELTRAETRLSVIGDRGEVSGTRVLTLTSPIDGTITVLNTAPGAYINDVTALLMTVANLDRVYVTANVPEKDLSFIEKGQSVDVSLLAYPGKTFSSTIQTVNQLLEPDTRRVKVRIAFDNPESLFKPNMFATVRVSRPPTSRLVIPTSALLINNDVTTVFVEIAPWVFERRNVVLDAEQGGTVAVISGLEEGDRIVVRGGVLLND